MFFFQKQKNFGKSPVTGTQSTTDTNNGPDPQACDPSADNFHFVALSSEAQDNVNSQALVRDDDGGSHFQYVSREHFMDNARDAGWAPSPNDRHVCPSSKGAKTADSDDEFRALSEHIQNCEENVHLSEDAMISDPSQTKLSEHFKNSDLTSNPIISEKAFVNRNSSEGKEVSASTEVVLDARSTTVSEQTSIMRNAAAETSTVEIKPSFRI